MITLGAGRGARRLAEADVERIRQPGWVKIGMDVESVGAGCDCSKRAPGGWTVRMQDSDGIHRIEAGALVGNHASVRVLEKLGFREEGTLRDYIRLEGGFHSCRFFGLLATDAWRPR